MSKARFRNSFVIVIVIGILLIALSASIQRQEFEEDIDQSAKFPLSELQKNVIATMVRDDIHNLIEKHESVLTYEDFNIAQTINAKSLFRAYEKNEISADELYRGKVLAVDGVIADISKDFLDAPILRLSSTNMFMNVQAYILESELSTMAGLSKGNHVSLACKGDGVVIGSPILKDCMSLDTYLTGKAYSRINRFLDGKSLDDQKAITMVSVAIYISSRLPSASSCTMNSTDKCLGDLKKVPEPEVPVGSKNAGYMGVINALHESGVVSDNIIAKIQSN